MSNDLKSAEDEIPEGYKAVTIQEVRQASDHLIVQYEGRLFGGILPELLDEGIEALIVPGAKLIIRYHTPDSGRPNQLVHMLIWHPTEHAWADLYADWD